MTELRGRTARWSAAALAAPVVASLFAGTTAWAVHHDPLHPDGAASATAATPAKLVAPSADPTLVALRAALLANAKKVDALSKQVAGVRAQAAAMAKGTSSARRSTYSGSGSSYRSSGSSNSSSSSRSSGGGNQSPIVVTIPAPAAPPPTHTTTGASGAVR